MSFDDKAAPAEEAEGTNMACRKLSSPQPKPPPVTADDETDEDDEEEGDEMADDKEDGESAEPMNSAAFSPP